MGLECERSSFIENFSKEYIFINLIPELVEKKDPPIITNIKKIKAKLSGVSFKEIPIFEMLLVKEKKIDEKS